jgi:hypothetical protein
MSTLALPLPTAVCTAFPQRKEVGGLGLENRRKNNTIINDRIFLSFYMLSKIMKP